MSNFRPRSDSVWLCAVPPKTTPAVEMNSPVTVGELQDGIFFFQTQRGWQVGRNRDAAEQSPNERRE